VVIVTPRGGLLPSERTPDTHWIGGWVGLRVGLDTQAKRKIGQVGTNPLSKFWGPRPGTKNLQLYSDLIYFNIYNILTNDNRTVY
jgi:hypothetical protein